MATTFKWSAANAGVTVLSDTQLAPGSVGIANGAFSAAGAAYDNSTSTARCKRGWVEVNLASFAPTTNAYVTIFMVVSSDGGATYEDVPSSTNPGYSMAVGQMSLNTGTSAKKARTPDFEIPPAFVKFVIQNSSNVAFPNSGSSATLYTYDEVAV